MKTSVVMFAGAIGLVAAVSCKTPNKNGSDLRAIKDNQDPAANDANACPGGMQGMQSEIQGAQDVSVLVTVDKIPASISQVGGPGHFGTVIKNFLGARGDDAGFDKMVTAWFDSWAKGGAVTTAENGVKVNVQARGGLKTIADAWRKLDPKGKLTPATAPFKLVAVVNRLDLWNGDPTDAGEGRLVFGLTPEFAKGIQGADFNKKLAIIFEFRHPKAPAKGANMLKFWAGRWKELSNAATFEAKLGALITDITGPASAAGDSMKRGQIRTNEFFLSQPWQFREWKLVGGKIVLSTAKQAMARGQDGQVAAAAKDYFVRNGLRIADGQFVDGFMPLNEAPLMAAESGADFGKALDLPDGTDAELKAAFAAFDDTQKKQAECVLAKAAFPKGVMDVLAQATDPADRYAQAVKFGYELAQCSGCHHSVAQQARGFQNVGVFYHIDPAGKISPFMTNEAIPERRKFLSQALCLKTPEYTTTRCDGLEVLPGQRSAIH